MAVGYDDAIQRFRVRNSWGADWGDGGYFTIPYIYLSNPGLASDFWTIRLLDASTLQANLTRSDTQNLQTGKQKSAEPVVC